MKSKIIISLAAMLVSYFANAQESKKNLDFVITIDETVVAGSISDIRIMAILQNGGREVMEVDYFPGNLSLKQLDFDRLRSEEVKTILLNFNYVESSKKDKRTYSYEIDIKKGWLEHYYYILSIYNTDKKKYKDIYEPLEGRSYTFEFEYPGGSVKRVKKKGAK